MSFSAKNVEKKSI